MSGERFAADPDALRGSGRGLAELRTRVEQLASDVNNIAVGYPDAAGDGDYRAQFNMKYVPLEQNALTFMEKLSDAVENVGSGATAAADIFEGADSDATDHARRS